MGVHIDKSRGNQFPCGVHHPGPPGAEREGATVSITPSRMHTSAWKGGVPVPSTTVPPRSKVHAIAGLLSDQPADAGDFHAPGLPGIQNLVKSNGVAGHVTHAQHIAAVVLLQGFDNVGIHMHTDKGTHTGSNQRLQLVQLRTQAAGKIHSDFERGFIRAEVCNFNTLMECGGKMSEVKARGLYRSEGKEYVVQDCDIIEFLFNV